MADSEIPEYRYFPGGWPESWGQQAWSQLKFLETCRRLEIPEDKIPKFQVNRSFEGALRNYRADYFPTPFEPPPFNVTQDSATSWRASAEAMFREHCDRHLTMWQRNIDWMVSKRYFRPVVAVRDKHTPLNLRYEWAVRRHCLGERFKAMETEHHRADNIRKTVYRIFDEVGISRRK
jgi:hypothetical protein